MPVTFLNSREYKPTFVQFPHYSKLCIILLILFTSTFLEKMMNILAFLIISILI